MLKIFTLMIIYNYICYNKFCFIGRHTNGSVNLQIASRIVFNENLYNVILLLI